MWCSVSPQACLPPIEYPKVFVVIYKGQTPKYSNLQIEDYRKLPEGLLPSCKLRNSPSF